MMTEEYKEWLEGDWFTSGETSWEEYYKDKTIETEQEALEHAMEVLEQEEAA